MSYVKESHLPGKDNYGYIFDQTVLVNATNYEKLFLKAMLEELSGRKQVAFFSKVFEKLIAMCNKEQIKCPSPNKAAQLCMALARTHVINLEQGPSALEWKISFNTPRDDVHFAVQGLKARVFRWLHGRCYTADATLQMLHGRCNNLTKTNHGTTTSYFTTKTFATKRHLLQQTTVRNCKRRQTDLCNNIISIIWSRLLKMKLWIDEETYHHKKVI